MKQVPLFLTGSSLSSRTAVGVQTKAFLQAHSDWLHLYWHRADFVREDPRSQRMEGWLASRWPALTRRFSAALPFNTFVTPWWSNGKLRPSIAYYLSETYGKRISAIYAAPLSQNDAKRMRHLVGLFERPFVLHLWDSLDCRLGESEDFRWLIRNAETVLTLSKPLADEVRDQGVEGANLIFTRVPSTLRANAPTTNTLRIALIGELWSYREGVASLMQAHKKLNGTAVKTELIYIGRKKAIARLGPEALKLISATGFLHDNQRRDEVLASCHVAFLPGPSRSPVADMRSRYSIPSRILDFLAVGIPMIGTVHPESATALLAREHNFADALCCDDPESLLKSIINLGDRSIWNQAQQANLNAFASLSPELQPEILKNVLASLHENPRAEPAVPPHTLNASQGR